MAKKPPPNRTPNPDPIEPEETDDDEGGAFVEIRLDEETAMLVRSAKSSYNVRQALRNLAYRMREDGAPGYAVEIDAILDEMNKEKR